MIPKLYENGATYIDTAVKEGLGRLPDALSCNVVEERNGQYELSLTYPVFGSLYSELKPGRFIVVKANETAEHEQMFRIYKVTTPLNGKVTVNAHHISYDLSGVPVKPFNATGIQATISGLTTNAMTSVSDWTLWTDVTNTASEFKNEELKSFRAALGGTEGSLLDTFSGAGTGEFEWDNKTVKFWLHRGTDNGVRIEYGKNLTDLNREDSEESWYTGVISFWKNDTTMVMSDIQYITNHASYGREKIYILDCTSNFENAPTKAQLNNRARWYRDDNNIGVPKVNIKASFVPLWQSEEYKDLAPLERVALCDTVTVYYPAFGVDVKTKVIAYDWDVIKERYRSITLGDARSSLADTINQTVDTTVEKAIQNIPNSGGGDQPTVTSDIAGLDLSSVCFIGDSFTQGYGLDNPNTQTYCYFLAQLLGIEKYQRFGAGGVGFAHVSASVNMNITQYWNSISDQVNGDTATVFVMAGYNDKDQSSANIEQGMSDLKTAIANTLPNARVVYMFNPCCFVSKRQLIHDCYFYARRYEYITIDSWWWQLLQSSVYQSDNVHPTVSANNTIGKMLASQIVGGRPHHNFTLKISDYVYLDAQDDVIVMRVSYAKTANERATNIGSFPSWLTTGWNSQRTGPDYVYEIMTPFNDSTGANLGYLYFGGNSSSIFACSLRNQVTPNTWSSGQMQSVVTHDALTLLG